MNFIEENRCGMLLFLIRLSFSPEASELFENVWRTFITDKWAPTLYEVRIVTRVASFSTAPVHQGGPL